MDTYYQDERAAIYQGDALAILAELPSGSVDAVITDPPYSSGGMMRDDRAGSVHNKYVQSAQVARGTGGAALPEFSGDNRDQRGYGYWCSLWLSECLRVARPGAAIALFTDWRQLPLTTDVLQAGGIVWRGIVPWYKPNGRRNMGRFANLCEYVTWGTAGPRAQDFIGDKALPGFFQVNTPRTREHITQKPVEIMREIVKIAPAGGTVLDPFAGSGTTGVGALLEGRRFVGIEQVPHYAEVAARRCRLVQLRADESGDQAGFDFTAGAGDSETVEGPDGRAAE
ncbi:MULTISPECIES: DNA-methyltransferase [Nocardia]|uniref:Methyltransferase n=1 Tax=Nocardia nova TaxID=37330 RepID=A0A2T2Z889_9NOCA|nr:MULTISPECIES: site-specific DNA-methyltransferase [Nocardia]PSR63974.1 site-specific DNA-methyltransferase [Nocardia nova]